MGVLAAVGLAILGTAMAVEGRIARRIQGEIDALDSLGTPPSH
jgi:hypothetical protein